MASNVFESGEVNLRTAFSGVLKGALDMDAPQMDHARARDTRDFQRKGFALAHLWSFGPLVLWSW